VSEKNSQNSQKLTEVNSRTFSALPLTERGGQDHMLQEAKRHKQIGQLEDFEFLEDERDLHIRVGTITNGAKGGCAFGIVGLGVLTLMQLLTRSMWNIEAVEAMCLLFSVVVLRWF
jgi:hypothetical protein